MFKIRALLALLTAVPALVLPSSGAEAGHVPIDECEYHATPADYDYGD